MIFAEAVRLANSTLFLSRKLYTFLRTTFSIINVLFIIVFENWNYFGQFYHIGYCPAAIELFIIIEMGNAR